MLSLGLKGRAGKGTRANLIPDPNNFSTGWTVGGTVAADATAGPDGTVTADQVTWAATGGHYRTVTVVPQRAYVWSYWVKRGTKPNNRYAIYDATAGAFVIASTLVAGTSTTDWTRVVVNFITPANCVSARVYADRADVAGDYGTTFLWGARLE